MMETTIEEIEGENEKRSKEKGRQVRNERATK